jgi:pectate lyase
MKTTAFQRTKLWLLGASLTAISSASWSACTYTVTNNWGSGFTGEIKVTNNTSQTVNGWSVSWQESGPKVTNAWNATLSGSNPYTATALGWNANLAPGSSATFGFQANGTAGAPAVSGSLCSGTSVSSSMSSSSRSSSISSSSRSSSISSISSSRSSSFFSSISISSSRSSSSVSSSSTANESSWLFEENSVGFCSTAGVIDNKHTGYTGTGFYDSENAVGATLAWSVSAASAKTYMAQIRFGNGGTAARRATLMVNDIQIKSLDFPTNSSWTQWQTANVELPLKAGVNSVKLVAETANGLANIDSISVTGNGITPASCPQVSTDCPLTQEGFSTVNANGQNGTTGGQGGQTVTVTNQSDLNRYATATEPYIIRVQGAIKLSPKGTEIRVKSDKTIIGVGTTGEIVEGGFMLEEGVHNVIIRNLTIRDGFVEGDWEGKTQDYDGIQMDTAHHIWIDHNHLTRMGDGLIDSRKDTSYLTVSWNILSDHNKAFGIGWTENVTSQMTIHHNWMRDLGTRNPSTDNVLRAHLFNNWLQNITTYGNYSRQGTNMVLENSVFDNVNNPHYYDTGSLVAIGNIYRNTTGQRESSGSSYSFFNPKNFYNYTLNPASEVEALLKKCAGPRAELGQ